MITFFLCVVFCGMFGFLFTVVMIAEQDSSDKKVIQKYVAENAKLKQELEAVGTAAYLYGRDDLKAENAKLREELEDQEGYDQMLRDRLRQQTELCVKTKAENAKLRELALEIWRTCPVDEDYCAKCPHHTGESDEDWCDIPVRMQELGIEVDG